MKIRILSLLAVVLGVTLMLAAPAQATRPDPEHKVWVCHATSGEGELKNGYNLIEVDIASTQGEAHLAHATTDPKTNTKFGDAPDYFLYDYIDVDPNNLPGKCALPVTTTTTQPEVTTTTVKEETTTTTTVPDDEESTTTTTTTVVDTTVTTTTVPDTTVSTTTTVVDTTVPPTTTTLPPPDLPKTGKGMTLLWVGILLTLGGLAALLFTHRGRTD